MRPATFGKGQQIFSRGDEGKELYFVRSGRVRLSVISGDGRELSLTHAVEGNIFGEIATLDGGPRTADATAVSAVSALVLSGTALQETMERHPKIALAMTRYLCGLIRSTDERLESIAMHPIEVRLARFLLSAVRIKWPDTDAEKVTLDLDMPQHELAMLIGASRPKVNAAIALLESEGAISRSGTKLVCNLERLEDYVDPV
jgi:CRP-like cAMP-binding protein